MAMKKATRELAVAQRARQQGTVLAVLTAVQKVFSNKNRWAKGSWGSSYGAKHCAVGAIRAVAGGNPQSSFGQSDLAARSRIALQEAFNGIDVVTVNDGRNGYRRIMAGLKKAIAKERAKAKA